MTKRGVLMSVGVAAVLALAAAVAWFGPWHDRDAGSGGNARKEGTSGDPAGALARRFAAAWQSGNLSGIPYTSEAKNAPAQTVFIVAALTPVADEHPVKVAITKVTRQPVDLTATPSTTSASTSGVSGAEQAVAAATVTWQLDDTHTWTYDTVIPLQGRARKDGNGTSWRVAWTPAVVHPSLTGPGVLRTRRLAPVRGDILGPDGTSLVGQRDVVEVGIQPSRAPDPAAAARVAATIVGIDPEPVVKAVQAAKPDAFVPVITLRRDAYDAVRGRLQPLPGTVFREDTKSLAPSKDFARALLGTAGPATKEDIDASKGTVMAGDVIGRSGLQSAQQDKLGGTPGLVVEMAPPPPGPATELKTFPAVAGRSITITLDTRTQLLADQVMATAPKPAALVAIRASTGDVLAVANGPAGASGYNRAMIGHYPPGSTFKVASGLTLFENGLTLDTPVNCPATITIGKVFSNAGGEVLGSVPFRKDFSESCNTAFVGQSRTITAQQLSDTAGRLGYRDLDLGVPVFGGSVPVTDDATEHAANMIGQGKVEASPFAVALASASVAAGHSVQPRLIIDPANPNPPPPGPGFQPVATAELREAMRLVVTEGTGTALRGVPGGDVAGKTGTAEYGNASPPRTHAWFTGYQGDVAFAVLVEDGGFGGSVAAPLAAQFLTRLANG